jgi:hypothetical protein
MWNDSCIDWESGFNGLLRLNFGASAVAKLDALLMAHIAS